jgi:DNA-binding transcriptional ArsR family regulator
MSFSKQHLFAADLQLIAAFAKALSHPARIKILEILAHQPTCSTQQMCRQIPLARTTICHHLELLRDIDVIHYKEQIPFIDYQLNRKKLKDYLNLCELTVIQIESGISDT